MKLGWSYEDDGWVYRTGPDGQVALRVDVDVLTGDAKDPKLGSTRDGALHLMGRKPKAPKAESDEEAE
jgi:hypothetical protein